MQLSLKDATIELVDASNSPVAKLDLVEFEMFIEKLESEAKTVGVLSPEQLQALSDWVKCKSEDKLTLTLTQAYTLWHKGRVAYIEFKKKLSEELKSPNTSGSPHSTAT